MAGEERFAFCDDQPKENPWLHDRLRYKPFCQLLAKIVVGLRVPNGYVIGLHGEWGSGKTTALNFVRAFLEKHNQEAEADGDKITLVDFRPWIVSGHQDLVAAFFKVMTESLGVRPNWATRQWKRALRFLNIGGDSLLNAVATVAVTMDPSAGLASKAITPVAKKSLGMMVDRFLAEPSLQISYEVLRESLSNSGKRFLVTIDDLDRLQSDEIRSIMQMVKTVGRLPNIIYLLAYDREIVWQALDGDNERDRPHFAEKIVQQEIELPKPSKESLLSLLDSETDFLIVATPSDTLRWHYIVRDGVRRWVRNARDALKLANAVKFSWPALKDELDPQDLLTMEGLRLFDPIAFEWIRWNRDFIFGHGRFMMSSDEARIEEVTALSTSLPTNTRSEVLQLIAVLFPQLPRHLQSSMSSDESHGDVVARRGVGCEPGYDAYFGLHPSSDAVPKALVDHIISGRNDEDAIVGAIEPYLGKRDRAGQPMIGQLLEELQFRFGGRGSVDPSQAMLDAMFRLGERVFSIEFRPEFFISSPRSHLSYLAVELLRAWGEKEAGEHLLAAFKKSDSPCVCAKFFVDRARELGVMESNSSSPPLIERRALDALGPTLIEKIEQASENGTLANAPFYWDIARAWKFLGDAAKAKAWISDGMNNQAEFLAKVTLGFVTQSLSERERSYSMSSRPDLDPDLYDPYAIQSACRKHLAGCDLDDDQRKRVQVVADAIDQMLTTQARETERD